MKLLAVTATRAEWGLLAPVLDALRGDARFTPQLLVTGQHLVAGSTTLAAITAEGHQPAALIDMELGADDGPRAISHSMGVLVDRVGKVFADLAPDAVLLLGDRYESLAVALAALVATFLALGTLAALAWLIASIVWGITASSAATTSTTMSVTCAPRARIEVNAA